MSLRTPATLSTAERFFRARRIGLTFGRVYLGIKANQFIARRLAPGDMSDRWSSFNRDSARSIYEAAIELRGLILKGCQFLGSRADVLPREYVATLSRLQDRVPAKPFPVVRRVVEHELGESLERSFRRFSPDPVASASLAQVHEAELRDGRRVAVKVQYPEIEALVRSDLANLRTLFRAVHFLERDVDLMPLVDELGTYVPLELDFQNEARNAQKLSAMFAHRDDVIVPEMLPEYTTRRVLVMEFMEGVKISDTDTLRAAGVDTAAVAQTLVESYCIQVFQHGFFHADPHPGNLLVQPEGQRLVYLDFGLAKDLPPRFREGIVALAMALLQEDPPKMVEAFLDLGFQTRDDTTRELVEVARLILELTTRIRERSFREPEIFEGWFEEVLENVRRNPVVRIPNHVVLMGRVMGLLSGVSRSLGSRVDLARTVLPYALGAPPAAT